MQPATFQFDDEHRARVIDCLRKGGFRLTPEAEARLMRDIHHSIETFVDARCTPNTTSRQLHDALHGIWLLAHEEDCPVGQLRARISQLPRKAIEYLDGRARNVIPRLLGQGKFEQGFLEWAECASAEDLIKVVRVLSAEGAQFVSRSRGSNERSPAVLEPRVLGQVRGAGEGGLKGGRPKHTSQQDLIRWLAVDWTIATGEPPAAGRSDHGGFGDLVHSIFQWLEEPAPDQALRRHWDEVAEARSRTAERARRQTS